MTEQDFIKIMHKKATYRIKAGAYNCFNYQDFEMWDSIKDGVNQYSHRKIMMSYKWDDFLEKINERGVSLNILIAKDTTLGMELYD